MAKRNAETKLIVDCSILIDTLLFGWITDDSSTKSLVLLIGVSSIIAGIGLMFRHQRQFREIQATEKDPRAVLFEHRKFRRRATASSLVAALGVFLTTLYWISQPISFAIIITIVLILLIAIMGLAMLDLMSVGIQVISQGDSEEMRQKLVDEYKQKRSQLDAQKTDDEAS